MTSAAVGLIELLEELREGMRCLKAYVQRLEDTVVEYREKETDYQTKIEQLEARLAGLHGAKTEHVGQSQVST